MTITELAQKCHEEAKALGWYDLGKDKSTLESIMMVVTELAEAVEEFRSTPDPKFVYYVAGKPEGFGVEIADAVIRLLDLCAHKEIPIEKLMIEKLLYNQSRGHRHGGKRF